MKSYCPVCKSVKEFVTTENPFGYLFCPSCSFRKRFNVKEIIDNEDEIIT